jgi:hypothetical protein
MGCERRTFDEPDFLLRSGFSFDVGSLFSRLRVGDESARIRKQQIILVFGAKPTSRSKRGRPTAIVVRFALC